VSTRPPSIGDELETELRRWTETFDALLSARRPEQRVGLCDECGDRRLVYALVEPGEDGDSGLRCRACAIAGGIREWARQAGRT
jgi:hypothetical protein